MVEEEEAKGCVSRACADSGRGGGVRLEASKVQRVGQNHRCQPVREPGPPAGAKIQAKWKSSMPELRVCLALISGVHTCLPSS